MNHQTQLYHYYLCYYILNKLYSI